MDFMPSKDSSCEYENWIIEKKIPTKGILIELILMNTLKEKRIHRSTHPQPQLLLEAP